MQIYLGNLAPEVDEPLLFELISQVAPVISVRLPRNKATPLAHQGYGFAQFINEADAEYVLQWLNSQPIKLFEKVVRGKPASNSISSRCKSQAPSKLEVKYTPRIFVGNLRPEISQNISGLRIPFEKFGTVADIVFVKPQSHQKVAHAFVTMADLAAAKEAIAALNGQSFLNSVVRVEFER